VSFLPSLHRLDTEAVLDLDVAQFLKSHSDAVFNWVLRQVRQFHVLLSDRRIELNFGLVKPFLKCYSGITYAGSL
jgi:hypothetical protein